MARRYKGGRPQNVCFRNLKGFKLVSSIILPMPTKWAFMGPFRLQVCCKQFQVPFYRRWQNGIMERQECWYLYGDQYGAFSMWEGVFCWRKSYGQFHYL